MGYLTIGLIALFGLLGIIRRRENAAHNLRYLLIAGGFGFVAFLFASSDPAYKTAAGIITILVIAMLYRARPPRRRRIPEAIRRRKIAEYEYKTGKKYSPRTHDIDHIVPFSKGGSHTMDNLRILEKGENRSRGARGPWWDVFGFWQ